MYRMSSQAKRSESGQRPTEQVGVPTGCSIFPKEILRVPRRWASTRVTSIVYWNEVDRGGHFAAFEQPELFVQEVRAFVRGIR
jgi:epoxide hydrolase